MSSKNKEEQARHEREVMKAVSYFLNNPTSDCFFGFTHDDKRELTELFEKLKQNEETAYPDFFGPHGCVELFRISSSREGRKGGPEQRIEDGKLMSEVNRDDKNEELGAPGAHQYCRVRPAHSYEALTEHLRKQFSKHLESMRKGEFDSALTVFIVELNDPDLECMFVPASGTVPDGISFGDLWPAYSGGKRWGPYRLSRDRGNLQWLARQTERVHYVVFLGPAGIEVINLGRVDALVPFLPWDLVACGKTGCTVVRSIPICVQWEVSDECR